MGRSGPIKPRNEPWRLLLLLGSHLPPSMKIDFCRLLLLAGISSCSRRPPGRSRKPAYSRLPLDMADRGKGRLTVHISVHPPSFPLVASLHLTTEFLILFAKVLCSRSWPLPTLPLPDRPETSFLPLFERRGPWLSCCVSGVGKN